MKRYVLDSYALIAYLDREEGYERISAIFDDCVMHDTRAMICTVNWGEVYSIAMRAGGEKMGTLALDTMRALPLVLVQADSEITLQAARFKAVHRIPYADAYAAAVAKIHKAELVTGDYGFRQLSADIRLSWLR